MTETLTAPGETGAVCSSNIEHLCRFDIKGAGQVTIDGNYAYLGYQYGPEGTSILDISDPRKPKLLSTLMQEDRRVHSHKVRVNGDIMFVNHENQPGTEGEFSDGGFKVYDISDRTNPKLITYHKTGGRGVHRFDLDENYAYLSTEMDGFLGHLLVIYDIRDPARPEEVSRWWMPGQNIAAGEEPSPKGREHRLHHAMRSGDKMYAGCWMSGYAIIDISDIAKPKTLGTFEVHPEAKEPSHTLLRVPFQVAGRDIAIAADEERSNRGGDVGQPHAPLYVFDVSDPTDMKLLATHHVNEDASPYNGPDVRFGAHQFREKMDDTITYVTWFAAGLRILDLADPTQPTEIGYFIPAPWGGRPAPQTNDVEMDHRGLLYVTDKAHGFDVIELSR
jgi:hypothetical protein